MSPGTLRRHETYRQPADLPAGDVLVVGGGNTGCQIAEDLAAGRSHEVHLAVGSRQLPLPQRLLGRDLFWWLDRTGLMRRTVESRVGRPPSAAAGPAARPLPWPRRAARQQAHNGLSRARRR